MGITELIARARRAQQKHHQKHAVQLEIPAPVARDEDGNPVCWLCGGPNDQPAPLCWGGFHPIPVLWASEAERMSHFRTTTVEA